MLVSRRAVIAGPLLGLFARPLRASTVQRDTGDAPAEQASSKSLAGSFLVSAPGQDAGPFSRSVVFMISHDTGGAMGVIINKPVIQESLSRLLETLGEKPGNVPNTDITVYFGGPVEPDAILVVHSRDFTVDKTRTISSLAAVSPVEVVLRAIANGKGPRHFLLLSGYAGWAPGQLEAELARAWWAVVPPDGQILYDDNDATKWQRAYDRRAIDL